MLRIQLARNVFRIHVAGTLPMIEDPALYSGRQVLLVIQLDRDLFRIQEVRILFNR
jgi:hypothetical protein